MLKRLFDDHMVPDDKPKRKTGLHCRTIFDIIDTYFVFGWTTPEQRIDHVVEAIMVITGVSRPLILEHLDISTDFQWQSKTWSVAVTEKQGLARASNGLTLIPARSLIGMEIVDTLNMEGFFDTPPVR